MGDTAKGHEKKKAATQQDRTSSAHGLGQRGQEARPNAMQAKQEQQTMKHTQRPRKKQGRNAIGQGPWRKKARTEKVEASRGCGWVQMARQ